MFRSALALAAVTSVLVLAGACGGSTNVGPSKSGPIDLDGGVGQTGPSGLPCDVDEILAQNCRKCHSAPPQYGAPMPLMTWENLHARAVSDETKKVYELAAFKIGNDAAPMPPPPNVRLSTEDQKTLTDWVAAGAPRGPDTCENTTGPTTHGVGCTPNLSLAPQSEWEMPEASGDEYVCWGVDLAKDPATHITAFVPKIDNTAIAHHVVLYEADSAYPGVPASCSAGSSLGWRMVLGWAPGTEGIELPPEVGFPISKDPANPTHYVVQMHYSNPQKLKGQKDKSRIDLCTTPPRKYEADVMAFGSQDFTIPPKTTYSLECSLTVPAAFKDLHFFAAMPHMHLLGTAMSTTLTPKAGGPDVDLGTMSTFDFSRQAWLPIDATTKAGDIIRTKCTWTNKNETEVRFGENTANEMCYSFTMYYPRIQSSLWSWAAPASGPPIGAACK
jgi:hypothetical protein